MLGYLTDPSKQGLLNTLTAQGVRGDDGLPTRSSSGGANTGYYDPRLGAQTPMQTLGRAPAPQLSTIDRRGIESAFAPPSALTNPGNNLTNPGYDEQALLYTQNRLLEDPWAQQMQNQYAQSQKPSAGEQYLNQNLGTLDGPGMGEQYWNQVQGQFNDPFAGEQFARQATQQFQANGPASAFYNQAMGQYGQFTGYQGAGNTQGQFNQAQQSLAGGTRGEQGLGQIAGGYAQKGTYSGPNNAAGQYGQSAASLAGGTAGERGLGQLAAQYGSIGQYQGGNSAMSQYQQNAASGPLAAQQFYNQVGGSYGDIGRYSDPNLAAGQYSQTQQAFGDLPIANFDPFYDRARQLATQDYNRQAAGRGVYGSSEALSGVGNVITDIEAQRANRSFDAEMARAQEQRARQQLLGEQARMGDLSSLAAFGANLSGLETFGNLANQAGNQTLGQQTMLGNQARMADQTALDAFNSNLAGVSTFANVNNMQGGLELDRNRLLGDMSRNADLSATDAFRANLEGASTYANINNQLANQELSRNELLGNMANMADNQSNAAQELNLRGLDTYGNLASQADRSQVDRYTASTNAMNNADRTALDRLGLGADIAFRGDDTRRANYQTSMGAARDAANLGMDRTRLGADIANTASGNDLARLEAFNRIAGQAEGSRQARQSTRLDAQFRQTDQMLNMLGTSMSEFFEGSQGDWENKFNAELAPLLQQAGYDQQQIDAVRKDIQAGAEAYANTQTAGAASKASSAKSAKTKG